MHRRLLRILGAVWVLVSYACTSGTGTLESDPTMETQNVIPIPRALVLRSRESMGMVTQNIGADITEQLGHDSPEGVRIFSAQITEDYRQYDELLLLLPEDLIKGRRGQFVLTIQAASPDPANPSSYEINQAWVVQKDSQIAVRTEVRGRVILEGRWGYTRYPDTRQVFMPLFDDPDTIVEAEVFHQTVFPVQSTITHELVKEAEWATVEFALAPQLIESSQSIDLAENLLAALDESFSVGDGEFLQWSDPLVTLDGIEAVATQEENRLSKEGVRVSFNITVEKQGQEIVRNKRIRPLISHPITILMNDGSRKPATLGISVSLN